MRLREALAFVGRRVPYVPGAERILRWLDSRLRERDSHSMSITVSGVQFDLDTRDLIDFRLAYRGGHDRHVVRYLQVQPCDAMWDVGANVGSICLCLAGHRPDLVIHAFEPSPAVAVRLRRNVAANPELAKRIAVHQMALSDKEGIAPFFASAEEGNSGLGSLGRMQNTEQAPAMVEVLTGDAVVARGIAPAPSLIKIDVEGYELEALVGMAGLLAAHRPQVVFEHEPYRLLERGQRATAVTDHLMAQGYDLFVLRQNGSLEPWGPLHAARHSDVVARPRN